MDFKQWLAEMPINQFNLVGNWDKEKPQYGYNRQDRGILTSPKAVAKIHKMWSNTKQNFDLYFVRSSLSYKNRFGRGETTPQKVKEDFDLDIVPNQNSITAIFTNNQGGEKIPMTGWMIAHRLAHSFANDSNFFNTFYRGLERDLTRLLRDIYEYDPDRRQDYGGYDYEKQRQNLAQNKQRHLSALVYGIGTMKSARERNLAAVNVLGEFAWECVAQYIVEGKITFQVPPRKLLVRNRKAWGHDASENIYARHNTEDFKDIIEEMSNRYTYLMDNFMEKFKGKIFVF